MVQEDLQAAVQVAGFWTLLNAHRCFGLRLQVTREDLQAAEQAVGSFGGDNRAGVPGTLHRISAIRNRKGSVVGLTCRVGRAVTGHIDMIRDILDGKGSFTSGLHAVTQWLAGANAQFDAYSRSQ